MGFFGDLLGTNVAKQAEESAGTIMESTQEGMGISQEGLGAARTTVDPYLMGGESAYNQVLAQMGLGGTAIDPTQTAMFQNPFNMAQGRIEEMMSSGGSGLYSGETMKALQSEAMGQYYNQYMPMLMNLGSQGQQGAFGYGGMAMNEATNRANMLMGGTETAEGLKVQGEAAKSSALGGLVGGVMSMGGQFMGGGGFGGSPSPAPAVTGSYAPTAVQRLRMG